MPRTSALLLGTALAFGCAPPYADDVLEDLPVDTSDDLAPKADSAGDPQVELKVTILAGDLSAARSAFRLWSTSAEDREITFYDTPDLDLFEAGIVLRSRVREGDDDSTVKLRPLDAGDVGDGWFDLDGFKCEIDRMPSRAVSSCSLTVEQDGGEIADVAAGLRDIDKLFSSEQEDFLFEHAPLDVDLNELTPLGPTDVQVWKRRSRTLDLDLTFELWTLPDGTRLLEISTRVDEEDADAMEEELLAYLASRGLDVADTQETKTRIALEYFAAALR